MIVFTDLDGTLLDHFDYSWSAASEAVEALKTSNIPLILNSSKTITEITQLRLDLGNEHPFVIENGGAVCVPKNYFPTCSAPVSTDKYFIKQFGPDYQTIISQIRTLRASRGYDFTGFSDFSQAELAAITGLSLHATACAQQRSCSEPVRWDDSDSALERFQHDLQERGLKLLKGGRFYHVMGETDKSVGLTWLIEQYRQQADNSNIITVALGDAPNDQSMLELVDIPVVIKPAKGLPLKLKNKKQIIYTDEQGPTGWNKAILEILNQEHEDG